MLPAREVGAFKLVESSFVDGGTCRVGMGRDERPVGTGVGGVGDDDVMTAVTLAMALGVGPAPWATMSRGATRGCVRGFVF